MGFDFPSRPLRRPAVNWRVCHVVSRRRMPTAGAERHFGSEVS